MLRRLHQLVGSQSQFIIATHSPILMAYPDSWIYQLTADEIRRIEYRQTDHYRVARQFLENPTKFFDDLG
jgi:predicted ATPase